VCVSVSACVCVSMCSHLTVFKVRSSVWYVCVCVCVCESVCVYVCVCERVCVCV